MKKIPTITKERLNEFGSKFGQYVLTDDWEELLPELTNVLQEIADSLTAEDAEIALSEMDHKLSYESGSFVFNFSTEMVKGEDQNGRYELILNVGSKKKPFSITVVGRS